MDSQEGAIYSVLDEMADQYVKEILLAYFLLLKHKYPATEVRPALSDPTRPLCPPCMLRCSRAPQLPVCPRVERGHILCMHLMR